MAEEEDEARRQGIEKVEASDVVDLVIKQNPRLLNGLSKEKQAQIMSAFSVGFMQVSKSHSGPLPDAETMTQYAQIIPDGAERIMAMAEKEQAFRHKYDDKVSKRKLDQITRGQCFGFIISALGIGGGVFLAYNDKETAGLVAIISSSVLLAGAYFTSIVSEKKQQT